jgi:prepilin-type processing-associated H-X9-DG protein
MADHPPSSRLSMAALVSPLLGLTGPLGFVFAFWTLRHINGSDGRLCGRILTFVGMGLGGVTTAALCVGLVAVALNPARAASGRAECTNKLRQIGAAVQHYHTEHDDVFPSGSAGPAELSPDKRLSFHAGILRYMEQRPGIRVKYSQVASTLDFQQPWDASVHTTALGTTIPSYLCRSDAGFMPDARGQTNYVGITGIGADAAFLPKESPRAGFFGYDRRIRVEDVKAGTSYLVMMTETTVDLGPWLAAGRSTLRDVPANELPPQVACVVGAGVLSVSLADDVAYIGTGRHFGGLHRGGANVLHVDGSVLFLNDSIRPDVFRALIQLQHEKLDLIDPP